MGTNRQQWRFAAVVAVLAFASTGTGAGAASPAGSERVTPVAARGAGPAYEVEQLRPVAGSSAFGASVNNRGWVAGTSSIGDGQTHAVLWRRGGSVDLGSLGGEGASSGVLWPVKSGRVVVGISYTDTVDPYNEGWSCSAFIPARAGYACRGFVWTVG